MMRAVLVRSVLIVGTVLCSLHGVAQLTRSTAVHSTPALPEQTAAERQAQAAFIKFAKANALGDAEKVLRELRAAQPTPGPLNIRVDSNTFYSALQNDRAIRILMLLLDSTDPRTREPAVRLLGYRQATEAGDKVLALLDDPSPQVRAAAASTLGRLRVRAAVPRILELLESDDPNVVYSAAEALAQYQDMSLLPALIKRYRRAGPDIRYRLLHPIGRFKHDSVKELLIEVLERGSTHEASNAVWSLVNYDDERIVPLLLKRLEKADPRRGEAYSIISVLGQSKDPRAYAALVALLDSDDQNMISQAAYALGNLGDPRAVPALIAALKTAENHARRQILQGLGMLGTDEAMEVLFEALKTADDNTRLSIIYSISRSENPRVIPVLMRALDEENQSTRQNACRALGRLRVKEAVPRLIELLKDTSNYVRYSAAAALGEIGDKRALKPMVEASRIEKNKLAKDWMILSISQINRYKEPVTLEQMLARIGEAHKVLWTKRDAQDADVVWIALENEFIVLFDTKLYTVRDFRDMLDKAGVGAITVNTMYCAPDRVWLGTSRGLYVYTRLTRWLEQYVVAMRHVDANVTEITADRGGVVVTVEVAGAPERYRYDPDSDGWSAEQ